MKNITVRLPEPLVAEVEAESRERKVSKSEVIRERLELAPRRSLSSAASLTPRHYDLLRIIATLKRAHRSPRYWLLA